MAYRVKLDLLALNADFEQGLAGSHCSRLVETFDDASKWDRRIESVRRVDMFAASRPPRWTDRVW